MGINTEIFSSLAVPSNNTTGKGLILTSGVTATHGNNLRMLHLSVNIVYIPLCALYSQHPRPYSLRSKARVANSSP
ncbi:hypothetical protein FKM82_028325 [Ascaphus truei]